MKDILFGEHFTCVMSNHESHRVIPNGSNFSPIEEGWTTQIIEKWGARYRARGRAQIAPSPLTP